MYGTQRAAEGWQDKYPSALVSIGFLQGVASACVLFHLAKNITLSVHGDDFAAAGLKSSLDWFYELTVGGRLGPADEDCEEALLSNRIVR